MNTFGGNFNPRLSQLMQQSEYLPVRLRIVLFPFMSQAHVSPPNVQSVLASFQNRSGHEIQNGQIRYALRVNATQIEIAMLQPVPDQTSDKFRIGSSYQLSSLIDYIYHMINFNILTVIEVNRTLIYVKASRIA